MKTKLLLLLGCTLFFASTLGASNSNFSSWETYRNDSLGFSIKYPAEWSLTLDPAFRMPQFRPGITERLALLSNTEDLFSGELDSNNHCLVEIFVSDADITRVRPIIHIGEEPEVAENVMLDNGLQAYQVDYDLSDLQIYEYVELYVPYAEGTVILTSGATSKTSEESCKAIFYLMAETLSVTQEMKEAISPLLDFSANSLASTFPRILQFPFNDDPQKILQQGWLYTYSTDNHNGIDYIEGTADRSLTWKNFDVLAAASGDATYIGEKSGWGHTVIVKHIVDGGLYYTLYAHLNSWDVPGSNAWKPVNAGDKIGESGMSGSGAQEVGIHLHFETSSSSWGSGSTRFDPYDLRAYRKYYPGWDKFAGLGNDQSWWDPPTGPSGGVTLFEHPNYGGWSLTLTEDDLDLCDNPLDSSKPPVVPCFTAPSWTNNASSLKVAPGWYARVHKHNIADANRWGDDASQGFSCDQDIPDFRSETFPDGSPLDNEVSRILVYKCPPSTASTFLSTSNLASIASVATDACSPIQPPSINDGASFVADVTIPDGFVANPGQALTKTWRVRNTGRTTWGSGYQLVFVDGEQMGAPGAVNVPDATPGQAANISVNLTAPSSSGEHKGYWRLRNAQGTYFGPTIWVNITVPGGGGPVPTDYELSCVANCPATVPPGHKFRPTLRATVGSGQLLPSRGDHLLHKGDSATLFGAHILVAVESIVNTGGTYDFVFYENNPITAPSDPGTYESTWQLWQNGQWAGPEYTIRFEVKSEPVNHPPNKPNLNDPGDWAVVTSTPTLRAQQNGDPDGDAVNEYYFDVFESHDIPKSGWISSNSWTPSGLGYYGYQWRVKVRDSKGAESNWSEVRHFNIKNPTPQIYSFTSQWCHEPWGPPDKICFCAETSGGGLELKLNSASDGSDSGSWKTIGHGDTNFRCQSDSDRPPNWGQLEYPSGQYRVRLYQRPNVGGWDAATTADIVVTVPSNQRPGEPFGVLPENLSYINSRTVKLDWQDTYRTNNYRLQASTDSSFGSSLLDKTLSVGTSEYTHTFNTDYGTIYWRITATGPYGSHVSNRQFHIDRTPPGSSVSNLAAVTTETKFSVNWSGSDARSGLRWYHIQVRDGSRPGR